MKLHQLKPPPGATRDKKRVGRGDRGRGGKTAGRGTKGTGAHGSVKHGFEGGQVPLKRRQPKLPGFTTASAARRGRTEYVIVNVGRLDAAFEAGEEVTAETLRARGLVPKKRTAVKLLGHGDVTKPYTVSVDQVSGTAREKLTAAGGTVNS